MEDQTYEVLMEIQSTLEYKDIIKNNESYKTDESLQTRNKPTFKKPLSCPRCCKTFITKTKLECHERMHTGEKPFSCSRCDKKFTVAGHLKRHERIHTDEKPFSCSKCDKKFTQSGHLKRHERKIHRLVK